MKEPIVSPKLYGSLGISIATWNCGSTGIGIHGTVEDEPLRGKLEDPFRSVAAEVEAEGNQDSISTNENRPHLVSRWNSHQNFRVFDNTNTGVRNPNYLLLDS